MQALQSQSFVSSDSTAMDELHDFLRRRRQAAEPFEDFAQIEQELHRLFVAAEREA
jgi:2-hydroxy-3-keto-5-methylthiopentenyl-1-phosphate phosphatase